MLRALLRLVFTNLLLNLVRLLALPWRRRPRWVRVTLHQPLPARPPHGRLLGRRASLATLARLLEELGSDARVKGLIVDLHHLSGGWAQAQSLHGMLAALAARGKQVVAHLSSPSPREYFVATAATRIALDESAGLALTGLAVEAVFLGRALGKLGARAETEFRGEYKSAGEMLTRDDMSPAQHQALDAVLDGLQGMVVAALAAGRRLEPARAAELFAGGPYRPADARRLGLVDEVLYADEVPDWLGIHGRVASARAWRWSRRLRLSWRPLRPARRVAVVPLHGVIVGGEGSGGRSVGARAATRTLAALREDRRVAAVVLHVDSRGGSAPASDLLWREVTRLAARKPVVAYLHDVAASGGYYIACAATRVIAQPATLTGSIGVVAGKVSVGGLLERLGVTAVVLRRGDAAAMNSPLRAYSDDERARLAAEVDALYRQFVDKVARSRKLDPDQAEGHARGRVWLGSDAQARRLVDELGDAEAALRVARALAGPPGARFDVVEAPVVPRRRTLLSRLLAPEPIVQEVALLASERMLALAPRIRVA